MTLARIIRVRLQLAAAKRIAINLNATRPTPVWPANLGGLR